MKKILIVICDMKIGGAQRSKRTFRHIPQIPNGRGADYELSRHDSLSRLRFRSECIALSVECIALPVECIIAARKGVRPREATSHHDAC